MECIRGLVNRGPLDQGCPNANDHASKNGSLRHLLDARQFTRQLHAQLAKDRNKGFEILDIRGRTGFMLKATLLCLGYTVIIKATTAEKKHNLRREIDNFDRLRPLQGFSIPVCVGEFSPRVSYWYHGELMAHMMILSWSGIRVQNIVNKNKSKMPFFEHEQEKVAEALRAYGAEHCDREWRNMLWNESSQCTIMIDLENLSWSARLPLRSTSGNITKQPRFYKRRHLYSGTVPSKSGFQVSDCI